MGKQYQYYCADCDCRRDGLLDHPVGIGGYSWNCPECNGTVRSYEVPMIKQPSRMGFLVTPEAIFAFMHDWRKCEVDLDEPYYISLPDFSDVPLDAKFVSVNYLPMRMAFLLIMEHEDFPTVCEGCEITIHDSTHTPVKVQISLGLPPLKDNGPSEEEIAEKLVESLL